MKKIAVILCGSGYLDGSEIREAVGTLFALSRHSGAEVHCFAPDAPQADVMNCLTGATASSESRNMLVESARIARGQVQALSELTPDRFAGMIMPGGYGVAKNLCTFASQGSNGVVRAELDQILQVFFQSRKPIGAICIAPAVLALAFKGKGFELTVGPRSEAAQEIEKLGHKHVVTEAKQCHVDARNRIVSTPAYMIDRAPLHEIFAGIQNLVDEVVRLA